jgi:hypothetical protein
MKVRCLVSNTTHRKCGRLERGLIKDISPQYFTPVLFEMIPQRPADIVIKSDSKKTISIDQLKKIQEKRFAEYNKKYAKRNEQEHQLALKRLQRRIG